MADYTELVQKNLHQIKQAEHFLPLRNPTFGNPRFEDASHRVLIVRLSPFRDVDRSIPHLFLFHEARRALPNGFIDMAFFPSAVERELFEKAHIPFLLGIQSLRSADEFDLVLISNAYTLELINLPVLLARSRIPLFAGQRGPKWPTMILGGSNTLATQAIIRKDGDSLVDGIFFGEGEGWANHLVSFLARHHKSGSKKELLDKASKEIMGLWVAGSFQPVAKATCTPNAHFLPTTYPILNTSEASTAKLQISYGCPAFCSFCLEGYDRKPYREIPLPDVLSAALQIKQAQGPEELNLYSFNFNTHQDILPMLLELNKLFGRVSLKSQRADILLNTSTLLEAEVEADKRDFTLGIEGISQRQRVWLHKSLPTKEIVTLLDRLFALKTRRIKLFYVLTGHETDEDIDEFRHFLRLLKDIQRTRGRRLRVIFSFGPLVRMPFTPLRHDELALDREVWQSLVGPIKSACETNGFEFRLAFDWPTYCVSQVLALGGYWLVEPIVELAKKGYCFDSNLPEEYWDTLREWLQANGHWEGDFLGEKGADYPFPLEFVKSNVSSEFLHQQYLEAQSEQDSGYCMGSAEQVGECLGCGACRNEELRRAITHHQIHQPDAQPYMAELREVMSYKRRLQPVYFRLRLPPWLAGASPALVNAFVLKEILACYPDLVKNLLSVRESLFTIQPNDRRFPFVTGETVFALRAWSARVLQRTLAETPSDGDESLAPEDRIELIGPADGFAPGVYTRMHLDMRLPERAFPAARARLEGYLRGAYVPYSLQRESNGYRFDLPAKALKKKILFGGSIEVMRESFAASLDVGHKFDLADFFQTFGGESLERYAQVQISKIEW